MLLAALLVEYLDTAASDGHINHSYPDVPGQIGHQRTAKVVSRCQPRMAACQGRHGSVPLAFYPSKIGTIHGSHHAEAWVYMASVLRFDARITLHVGLSQT